MLLSSLKKWLKNLRLGPGKKKRRKGVTAMEYLVCISLILVVVIIAVQSLASSTKGLLTTSGDATSKTVGK